MNKTALSPTTLSEVTSAHVGAERGVINHLERSTLFRDYRDAFEETTSLPLALRPVGSFQSPLHHSKHVNEFCVIMAANNPACASCLRLQARLESEAVNEPCTVECMAGLTESAAPIRAGDRLLGHLQTGQVLTHRPTPRRFHAIAKKLEEVGAKVDLAKLESAYYRTRVMARRNYDAAVRLIGVFAQHLSTLSNQIIVQESAGDSPVITKARAYLAEHLDEQLSLAQVARAVNTSAFYFCKIFKKATGVTFTEYLARLRIERVKQMLLNPHTRVSEAAFAAGFQSLSQFNRVFRELAGESPSTYRDRLHVGEGAKRTLPAYDLPHAA